jgi:hypothetical protein
MQRKFCKKEVISRRSWHTGVSAGITLIRTNGDYARTGGRGKGRGSIFKRFLAATETAACRSYPSTAAQARLWSVGLD